MCMTMWTRRPLERMRVLLETSANSKCLRMARQQQRVPNSGAPPPRSQQRRRLSTKANDSGSQASKPTAGAPKTTPSSEPTTLKETLPPAMQGPSWLWAYGYQLSYPLRAYNRAQNKRPYLVQLCSSLVIYFLGDLSSQFIERPVSTPSTTTESPGSVSTSGALDAATEGPGEQEEPRRKFSWNTDRSLRALIIGGVFSMPSYHWFLFLSHNFNISAAVPHAAAWSLALKVVINQAVFTPVFNSYFFGMQSFLSSEPMPRTGPGSPAGGKLSKEYVDAKLEHAWQRISETVPTSWYNSCKFWPFVTAFSFTFVRPQSRSVFAGIVAIGWQSYLGILNQRAERRKRRQLA